jgi:hypothetical protein
MEIKRQRESDEGRQKDKKGRRKKSEKNREKVIFCLVIFMNTMPLR